MCTRSLNPTNVSADAKHVNGLTYNGSDWSPWKGKLGLKRVSAESQWCADSEDRNKTHFLQLDLKKVKIIYSLAILGHSSKNQWVKSLILSSSLDGLFWKQYRERGVIKVAIVCAEVYNIVHTFNLKNVEGKFNSEVVQTSCKLKKGYSQHVVLKVPNS